MQDQLANPPTKIRIIDGAINTVHTLPKTMFSQEHIEILEVKHTPSCYKLHSSLRYTFFKMHSTRVTFIDISVSKV